MPKKVLLIALILTATMAVALAAADYEKLDLVVPKGDPGAGRDAFIALGCTSCHAVEGDEGLPAPVAGVTAPKLDRPIAKTLPGKLASAIVAPSHKIDDKFRAQMEGELSPMGDYSDSMTVRQLVDLVAYIQSIE